MLFQHGKNQQILAPMVRTGTLPTRRMALDYGADIVFSPEYVDRAVIGKRRRVVRDDLVVYEDPVTGKHIFSIDPVNERGKLVFQLGSANPELAVQAAQAVIKDVDGIDLNCGCPKPFSTIGGMGSHLLSNQPTLINILNSLVQEITHGRGKSKPVSCKIRIVPGSGDLEARMDDTIDLVKRLEDTGIAALTIHARLPSERYSTDAHQEVFRKIKEVLNIPVYANGDIWTQEDAARITEDYGVDGVMFARAAQRNVSVFKKDAQLDDALEVARTYARWMTYYENPYQNSKFVLAPILAAPKMYKDIARSVAVAKSTPQLVEALGLNFENLTVRDSTDNDDMYPYDPSIPLSSANGTDPKPKQRTEVER